MRAERPILLAGALSDFVLLDQTPTSRYLDCIKMIKGTAHMREILVLVSFNCFDLSLFCPTDICEFLVAFKDNHPSTHMSGFPSTVARLRDDSLLVRRIQ